MTRRTKTVDGRGRTERNDRPTAGDMEMPRAAGHRLRLAIADDDPAILDQVSHILDAFNIVARAANGRLLIDAVDDTDPDVVVTDISMPEVNGIQAARQILRAHPLVKVVLLSVHDDPHYVDAAFDAGASGYVLKIDASAELVDAVHAVSEGGIYRSHRLA